MIGTRKVKSRVILQIRDRKILSLLETLRVASREQITSLCGFGSATRANTRLSQLVRAKYLARDFIGTIKGGRLAIYFIPHHGPTSKRGPAGFEAAVVHELELGQLYLMFHQDAQRQGRFIRWRRVDSQLGTSGIIPDALIEVDAQKGSKTLLFEFDRATEGTQTWRTKTIKYLDLARRPDLSRLIGNERFAVLVVVPTAKRLAQVCAAIASQTTKIFWISTIEAIKRDGLFGPIWLRPASAEKLSLLGGT